MTDSLLLAFTGNAPIFRILDFLIENKGLDFSKSEIADGAGISRGSVFNHWHRLEEFGVLKQTRQFGKTKLYTLDSRSPVVRRLLDLERTLIGRAMKLHAKKQSAAL